MKLRETLIKIQAELDAPKNQHNRFGNYNYRSCEDILAAVKPLLGDCTLLISDEIVHFPTGIAPQVVELIDSKGEVYKEVVGGDRFYIKATATIADGTDSISVSALARESEFKKGMDESQITGSASSYARKYALNGLFAIDDTKDADTADNRATKPKATAGDKQAAEAANAKIASSLSGINPDDVEDSLNSNGEALPWESGLENVMCPLHDTKMWEKTGQYGTFYSHGEKQPDGSYKNCNGKGWK